MKRVSTMGLAGALIFGSAALVTAAPALAVQAPQEAETFNPDNLSDGVRGIVVVAQAALQSEETAPDTAAIMGQLQSAAAIAENGDDRFIIAQLMLQNASRMQTDGMSAEQVLAAQLPGLRLGLESNRVSFAQRPIYWLVIGNAANSAGNSAEALEAYQNVIRYDPDNGDALIQSAAVQFAAGDNSAGYASSRAAIASMRAAGMDVPSSWHAVPFRTAYQTNDVARVVEFGTSLLESEPTPQNWNEVLRVYQAAGRLEDQPNLDLLRLARATGGLDQNLISEYVQLAMRRGLPREALDVYNAAVAGNAIQANQELASELSTEVSGDQAGLAESEAQARSSAQGRVALNTADAYASYGETADALELYDLALEKGGVDAGTVHLRKGALLYSMGQRDAARTEFEAVVGDREPHAAFWLHWLDEQTPDAAPAAAEPTSAE